MWTLLSVKFVMFLGLKLLMSTRKNALKFVVEKKKDGFVNQLLFFKPCRCCMHVNRCVERSREKKSSNIVVSPLVSLVKDQVSLLFSLGISATPLNNEMSEADKSKVESGQYSIVYGHRSRGWRHTMARGNAHKLSETYKNSVRRC